MKALSSFVIFLLVSFVTVANAYNVFYENGKAGLKARDGKVVVPAKYEAIGWSNGGFSVVNETTGCKTAAGWAVIHVANKLITRHEFQELYPSSIGLLIASRKSNGSLREVKGCINTTGKVIVPFEYDGIEITGLRAIVFTRIGNQFKFGVIDLENKTIVPQQYQDISSIGATTFAIRNFEGKTALFSESGNQLTDFVIDSISSFQDKYAFIYEGKHVGLLNKQGKVVIPAKYREIKAQGGDEFHVREADEWVLTDDTHKPIASIRADSVVALGRGLLKIKTGRHTQLMSTNLSPIGNAVLTDFGRFHNGRTWYKLGSLQGVFYQDGTVVVPALYETIHLGKNYVLAKQGGKQNRTWILFDSLGRRKTTKAYTSLRNIEQNLFAAEYKKHWGVIDEAGKEIVACVYDSIIQLKDGNLVVKFQGLYGIIGMREEWKVAPRTNKLQLLQNNRYLEFSGTTTFLKDIQNGAIYFTSNKVEPRENYLLEYIASGAIWKIGFDGLILDRQVMPQETTERVYDESEGLRAIKRNGRYGFIDSRGRLRIANRYEDVQPFSNGMAAVKILGKWGFVDKQDNIAVQPVYEEVSAFKNEFALVKQKGLYGLINKQGKLVLPIRYQQIHILPSKNLMVVLDNGKGIADATGRILIHPKYDAIEDLGNGFVIVGKSNLYGVINYGGVTTIPLVYRHIAYEPHSSRFILLKPSGWISLKL